MPGGIAEELEWRPLRSIDNGRLREARLQAHYAVQWLARVARGYIPPQPDDGHTSLNWVSALNGFMTQPLKNGTRLSLQVNNLTLALHESDAAAAVKLFSLNGRSNEQARQWLGEQFSKRNLDTRAFDADSPYEIPAHAIAQGAVYDAAGSADALIELAAWFANAANLLGQIQKNIIERKLATSPVCCWPHHFDLATLTMLPKPATDETGYVGVGLSPGDGYYDEPYFYVSVYPKPDPCSATDFADVRPLAHPRIYGRHCAGSQDCRGKKSED